MGHSYPIQCDWYERIWHRQIDYYVPGRRHSSCRWYCFSIHLSMVASRVGCDETNKNKNSNIEERSLLVRNLHRKNVCNEWFYEWRWRCMYMFFYELMCGYLQWDLYVYIYKIIYSMTDWYQKLWNLWINKLDFMYINTYW